MIRRHLLLIAVLLLLAAPVAAPEAQVTITRGVPVGADGSVRVGTGGLVYSGVTFANLGTPPDGTVKLCTDCTYAQPCAGGGTGAIAKRLNGGWRCD